MGHADQNGGQAPLAWSKNHGATWTKANWQFAEFGLVEFINFGKDYARRDPDASAGLSPP
jgi:hypothetical protein